MRRLSIFALALLVLSPVLSSAEPTKQKETITIVADQWCPYNCNPSAKNPGFMIEIATKAFAKHDIAIEYSIMAWARAIEQTRNHQYTAIVGAAKRDAPDFIFPKTPQAWVRTSFYTKTSSNWKFSGLDSLAEISLGLIADYSYSEAFDGYVAKHRTDPRLIQIVSGDNGLEANIKKLLLNRIGALIEGEYVMSYTLAKNGWTDKVKNVGSLAASENDAVFIAFSPKAPNAKKYAEILSKETQLMRKNGELKKILDRYNVKDWQK